MSNRLKCGPVDTTTVQPSPCLSQPCRNLYQWDEDACECVCPRPQDELCQGSGNTYTGDCNCAFSVSTRRPCIDITCSNGGIRNMNTCDCEGGITETTETTEAETEFTT